MLINDKRALAYTERIVDVRTIEGADNIELATILGWTLIVKKGEFKAGDRCVYFEIDSKLPEVEWAEFLAPKKYKVKPYKLNKFGVVSMGLALPVDDRFGVELPAEDKADVTDLLKVTYADERDIARKKNVDKYEALYQRKKKFINNSKILSALWRYEWGRKLLFMFLGRKKDKKGGFPDWVKKTDSERIQNMPYLFDEVNATTRYYVTEKIHGTSTTFTARRVGRFSKEIDFRVCSRNVSFIKDKKEECFYKENAYLKMAERYNIQEWMTKFLKENHNVEHITFQGETFGDGVQKRAYGLKNDIDIRIFNIIIKENGVDIPRYLNPPDVAEFLILRGEELNGLQSVPVLGYITLPKTVEETLALAKGRSVIDGGEREGLVFRNDDATMNFKAVDVDFMLKY